MQTPLAATEWASWLESERKDRPWPENGRKKQAERLCLPERLIRAIEDNRQTLTLRWGTRLLLEQAFRRYHALQVQQ